jgi:hypothetical protein
MFSVGQRVWHRDGKRSGKVLECDGGRVYIEQDNGAELDFPETELTAAPPGAGQGSHAGSKEENSAPKQAGYVMPNRNLVAADITPEHTRVLGIVPTRTVQAVAALYERRSGARKFSALDVAGKLRNVSTTLIQPGLEFKLGYEALIERRRAVRVRQRLVLVGAIRGSARRRAGGRVALRNGTQWRQPL